MFVHLIFAAENDPAIRKCLSALLFVIQYTFQRKGVACHAFTNDFENFSLYNIIIIIIIIHQPV